MSLLKRIEQGPPRQQVEKPRSAQPVRPPAREPRWLTWTRANGGKDLTGRTAA